MSVEMRVSFRPRNLLRTSIPIREGISRIALTVSPSVELMFSRSLAASQHLRSSSRANLALQSHLVFCSTSFCPALGGNNNSIHFSPPLEGTEPKTLSHLIDPSS